MLTIFFCDCCIYCIVVAGSNILGDVSKFSIVELEDMGIGLNTALLWEESLHNALMPVTPQASMGSLAESEFTHESQLL